MAIAYGSAGTSANVNSNLMSRTVDTDTLGRVDLLNPLAASGSSILNIQRCLNSYASFIGATTSLAYNDTPTWLSNILGTTGDTLKQRIEAIDAEFSDLSPYVPDATAVLRGLVSTGVQTFGGDKTFTGDIVANNLSGTNSGDITLDPVGSAPNANGASLTGQVLNLEPASDTFPGVVNTGAQSFGGIKTFVSGIISQVYAWLEGQLRLDSQDNSDTGSNVTIGTPTKTIVRAIDALTSVEGINAPAFDMKFWFINDTGGVVTILNNTGTAANQIDTGSGADIDLADGAALGLLYDLQGAKWRVVGGSGGGSGGGLPTRNTFAGTSIVATSAARQVWVYTGTTEQTLSSIDTSAMDDQAELIIINGSTGSLHVNDNPGTWDLNGDCYLAGQYAKICLRLDTTFANLSEDYRNGL